MPKSLATLIALTCVAVLAASGWYLYSERQDYLAQQRREKVSEALTLREIERLKARLDQTRLTARLRSLTVETCNRFATATLPEKPGQPPRTTEHLEELRLCDDNGRLGAYERHQLDLAGVF